MRIELSVDQISKSILDLMGRRQESTGSLRELLKILRDVPSGIRDAEFAEHRSESFAEFSGNAAVCCDVTIASHILILLLRKQCSKKPTLSRVGPTDEDIDQREFAENTLVTALVALERLLVRY